MISILDVFSFEVYIRDPFGDAYYTIGDMTLEFREDRIHLHTNVLKARRRSPRDHQQEIEDASWHQGPLLGDRRAEGELAIRTKRAQSVR